MSFYCEECAEIRETHPSGECDECCIKDEYYDE